MAHKLKALQAYRPKIQNERRMETDDIVEYIARGTSLNPGEIGNVIKELQGTILFFTRRGNSVTIKGLGTYYPGIKLDGSITLNHLMDAHLRKSINVPEEFKASILHNENKGKTYAELIEIWNTEHPTDPIV